MLQDNSSPEKWRCRKMARGSVTRCLWDDVVEAVLRSLRCKTALPGPYLISAAKPVTWRDYYLVHSASSLDGNIASMTDEEVVALIRESTTKRSGFSAGGTS